MIPVGAAWSAYNIVVLFLVCMLSLQGRVKRGEERFACDEPVWIIGPGSARTLGRLNDISLSGGGIYANACFSGQEGKPLQVFISEVGHIPCRLVWQHGQLLEIKFELGPCVERDLLIRKLFTSGLVATTVNASAWSATAAVLESILLAPSAMSAVNSEGESHATAPRSLPAESLVILPNAEQPPWINLASQRRAVA